MVGEKWAPTVTRMVVHRDQRKTGREDFPECILETDFGHHQHWFRQHFAWRELNDQICPIFASFSNCVNSAISI